MISIWVYVQTQKPVNPMWARYIKNDGNGEFLLDGAAVELISIVGI